MNTKLVALAVCALAIPGCIQPEASGALSEGEPGGAGALYTTMLSENVEIAMEDGIVLDSWVFRPDTTEPVPVVINFSPYWSNLAPPVATGGDAYSLYLIDLLVPRGYAVALVSARGTGLSEGCFTIGGPVELADEDAVATYFGTVEWSNGNVSATGKSYDGTMANGLLTKSNPHVKTIVPTSPISELYKYNYFHGVPYTVTGQAFNTYYVAQTSVAQQQDTNTFAKTPTRFCAESADVQAFQVHGAATGDYGAYWQARNYTALLPDVVEPSVFHIHGLQDWNVKPDHMDPWIQALRERGSTVKMMLGQWGHDYPHRDDFNETLVRWFDHYLKGVDNGIEDEPLVQVQDTEGIWRDEAEWPPARAAPLVLHPSADGTLAPGAGTGSSKYLDAPRGANAVANSFVRFTSDKIATPLRITGAPSFHATLSSTGPRATLSATLFVDGKPVDHGFLDLAHRASDATSEPMTPGVSYDVTVTWYPQDIVIPKGARLLLEIGHVPTAGLAGVTPVPTGAVVTLTHGEGTYLSLPTLAYDDVAIEDPQPRDIGCWTC